MIGLLKAVGVVKVAVAAATLAAVTAFAATNATLPSAAQHGQAQATAAATPQATPGGGLSTAASRLAANKARLLEQLNDVLAQLQANPKVNQHAIDALKRVIAEISTGDTGLNRAIDALSNAGTASQPGRP